MREGIPLLDIKGRKMSYFSIIVPVYNTEAVLENCAQSILNQTFGDFELIFVDDGSSDSSVGVIEELAGHDDRIKLIRHEKNESAFVARYTGMKKASGDYYLFVDSDDCLSLNALELMYNKLQVKRVDVLRFGHEEVYARNGETNSIIDEKNRVIMPLETDNPLDAMLRDLTSPNLFKNCYAESVVKEAINRADIFYCNMCEDVYWTALFFDCAKSFAILEECLYHYSIGGGMSTTRSNQTKQRLIEYKNQIRLCVEHLKRYFECYSPERLPLLNYKYLRMNCFLMLVFVIDEPDLCRVLEYLKVFDEEGLEAVYIHGCNKVLPFKILRQYGNHVESSNAIINVSYLEDLMYFECEE